MEAATAFIGTVFLLCAGFATQRWLDRHFLPSWFLPRPWLVLIESSVRVVLAAAGVWLVVWLRPRAARLSVSAPGVVMRSAIAIVLALGAGELVLRQVQSRPVGWLVPGRGATPPPRSAARLDLRAGADRAARGWRARHRLLVRCGGISCPAPRRTRRSRAADDRVHRRVRDVRRRSGVGGQRARAGRRHDGDPEREPRRARLQQRSGVSEARARTAPLPAARRRRLVVHDGDLRPEPGRQPAASGTRPGLAPGGATRTAGVARHAARPLPQGTDRGTRHRDDTRSPPRDARPGADKRSTSVDHRSAVRRRGPGRAGAPAPHSRRGRLAVRLDRDRRRLASQSVAPPQRRRRSRDCDSDRIPPGRQISYDWHRTC